MTLCDTAANPKCIAGTDCNRRTSDCSHEYAFILRFGMPRHRLQILLFLLSGWMLSVSHDPAVAQRRHPADSDHATNTALPADIRVFKVRRDRCDHLRGEMPGDGGAGAEILHRQLRKSCLGTVAQLAVLRRRYAGDKKIISILATYEDSIE